MDYLLAGIGIIYVVLGTRAFDLGLASWKAYGCLILGVIFIMSALIPDRRKKK